MQKPLYFIAFIFIFTLLLGQNPGLAQAYESNRWYQISDFQEKVNNLPSEATTAVIMPVLFGVGVKNISPNFGVPRSGGRSHEGEDIMAIKGTPIISPTPAIVLRTGFGASAGNYVYTINPGGETFVYMHLDRIGEGVIPGMTLSQGSLIGYVGDTGNASGGAAHLHFEIHNTTDNPTNPFPRLTAELSLEEKMIYLTAILDQTTDSPSLALFLVNNFRTTFVSAVNEGVVLPLAINNLLGDNAASLVETNNKLDLGSAGTSVVVLQRYLIQANASPAVLKLKTAGATGIFGPATKAALIEFQLNKGIKPASGYYGPVTKAYISAHPLEVMVALAPTAANPPKITPIASKFSHDLRLNMTDADVKTLQVWLNTNGFKITASGVGSPGKETTYFGLATESAVKKFQTAHKIKPVNGIVGPITRATLNSL
jgi:peptidoglycan hydrolase-like protein with peptidoglycan-binding domain